MEPPADAGTKILAACGAGIDRSALPLMELLWLSAGKPEDEDVREAQRRALDFYGRDELRHDRTLVFREPQSPDVQVTRSRWLRRGRLERYRWLSGYRCLDTDYQNQFDSWERNRWACAEAFRHKGTGHPTLICLHSWMTGYYRLQRHVYLARSLYRSGLDVVLPMLPFHGPRNPRGSLFGGQLFPGTDLQRTNEGFLQSIWDLRCLIQWLQESGSGPVGVMGMSLGGYVAALLPAVEPNLAFSIPTIPLVSLSDTLWSHGEGGAQRKNAEAQGITLETLLQVHAIHAPLNYNPLLSKERLMIVGARGDQVCPPSEIERLWRHWGQPRLHWFSGGHIAHFGRRRLFSEIRSFIDGVVRA